jgi:hypothetical protein
MSTHGTLSVAAALLMLAPPVAHAQGLAGFLSPGPLAEPHAELDAITRCTKCHQAGRGVAAAKCLDCHDEIRAQVRADRGYHAEKGETCQPCHLDHRGRAYSMIRFDPDVFDHDATGFALRGGHAPLDCHECHAGDTWTGLDPACTACHDDPHGADQSTRALAGGCTACHDDSSWRVLPLPAATFDHGRTDHAAYALDGAHQVVPCDACHAEWRFLPTAHDACTTCHDDPHRAPFSDDCQDCHQVRADWRVPRFDHAVTGTRLLGVHRDVACKGCHPRGVLRPIRHDTCADCHRDPHHGQFDPRPCDACHTLLRPGFALSDFDHAAVGWPLEGRHTEAACADCHGEGAEASYVAVSRVCADCHDDPHAGRLGPGGCDTCHTPTGWPVAAFDHARTAFPLTGAHSDLACAECHPPHVWAGLAHASCADCHTERPHDASVPAEACAGCHVTAGWTEVTFDHAASTAFSLAPQHGAAPCTACHAVERFTGADPACAGCHLPDRPVGHFEGPCGDCHRDPHWRPADLGPQGHAVTGFPLDGSHQRLACASCHTPGVPAGAAPTGCVGCHATDDVHRNLLGDACGDCHTPLAWVRTRWRHQRSGWPLHGAHRLAACDDCHAAGYVGTPRDCRSCHLAEASRSVPAHQSPFFDDCARCHKPFTWATPGIPH